MPFLTLHKVCSFLLVATGFLAVLLPNELHPLSWLVVIVGVLVSWHFEPPRTNKKSYRQSCTVLTVFLVLALILLGVVGIYPNPILLACYILIVLQLNKLFNRNSSRDYLQLYVLSFLMLTIGTILNTDLGYAVTFLLYVIFITWTLTLFHLRREIEGTYLMRHSEDLNEAEKVDVSQILQSKRLIRGSFLGATSLIALTVFALSSVIFFLFPRIGFGLFFQRKRTGPRVSGFSNRVELGSFGRIRLSRAVILRIELPHQKKPVMRLPYYWRGASYDRYDGHSWKRSRRFYKAARFFSPSRHVIATIANDKQSQLIQQIIYQEPLDFPVLFGLGRPYVIDLPMNIPTRVRHMVPRVKLEQYSDSLSYSNILVQGSSLRYTVYSLPQDIRPAAFKPRLFAKHLKKMFLQLPPNLDSRIRRLALRITRGRMSHGDKARAVQLYLQNNFTYSLSRKPSQGPPLSDFLFQQKIGHCEYFSSAMAILLRTVKIPTRQVTGFYTASWNAYGKYYAVRQSDAHSWVEVYEPKYGWKRYDPSPTAPTVSTHGVWKTVEEYFDSLRLAWYKWVIEYDLENQIAFLRNMRKRMASASQQFNNLSISKWFQQVWSRPVVRLSILSLLLLLFGLIGFWRWRRKRSYPRTAKAVFFRATKIYRNALLILERNGFQRNPSETPHEFLSRLEEEGPHCFASMSLLTEHYLQLRYNPDNDNASSHLERLQFAFESLSTQVKEKPKTPSTTPTPSA